MIIPFSIGPVNTFGGVQASSDTEPRRVLAVEHVGKFVSIVWQGRTQPSAPVAYREFAYIRVAIKGTCDEPCCERHCRSVDDNRDYCQAHALAQETIA